MKSSFPSMNLRRGAALFSLLLLLPAGAGQAGAADSAKPVSPVEVTFVNREKFADVKDSSFPSEKGRDATLARVAEYLVEKAQGRLQAGQRLTIAITDFDLAGEFESRGGSRLSDMRQISEAYPPRASLTFRLIDQAGAVVKEGKRDLADLSFTTRTWVGGTPRDALRYEKAMLDDWLWSEFRANKKKKS
jgi:hypothetical protein